MEGNQADQQTGANKMTNAQIKTSVVAELAKSGKKLFAAGKLNGAPAYRVGDAYTKEAAIGTILMIARSLGITA